MLSRGQISGLDGRAAQASFASSSFGKTRSRVDSRASFSPAPVASRGRSPKGSRRRCMAASTCARGNLRTIAREQAAARVCRVRLNKGLRLRVWRSAVIAQTTSKHRVRPPAPHIMGSGASTRRLPCRLRHRNSFSRARFVNRPHASDGGTRRVSLTPQLYHCC